MKNKETVLVLGSGKLAGSVPVCLAMAGHMVTWHTSQVAAERKRMEEYFNGVAQYIDANVHRDLILITGEWPEEKTYGFSIVITEENLKQKKAAIDRIESNYPAEMPILVNIESISLREIQQDSRHPERIIGTNWTYPAHATLFLEFICNELTDEALISSLLQLARHDWNKDPYLITTGTGIRSRVMSAMLREAFYLVENGYASVEDVDRACRNDAGYYLPFAGNFRYMDLMGPYAYGLVMKELNQELSREKAVPQFIKDKIRAGDLGMEYGKGFYDYPEGEAEAWQERITAFAHRIRQLMNKYPEI